MQITQRQGTPGHLFWATRSSYRHRRPHDQIGTWNASCQSPSGTCESISLPRFQSTSQTIAMILSHILPYFDALCISSPPLLLASTPCTHSRMKSVRPNHNCMYISQRLGRLHNQDLQPLAQMPASTIATEDYYLLPK